MGCGPGPRAVVRDQASKGDLQVKHVLLSTSLRLAAAKTGLCSMHEGQMVYQSLERVCLFLWQDPSSLWDERCSLSRVEEANHLHPAASSALVCSFEQHLLRPRISP